MLDDDDDDVAQSGTFAAIRTSRYVYVDNATGELELYDLDADPYQLQNQILNPAYDAAEAALARRLAALRSCAGDGCRTKPALEQKLPRSVRRHGRSCRPASDFLVRLRGPDSRRVIKASFRVAGKRAGHDRAAAAEEDDPPAAAARQAAAEDRGDRRARRRPQAQPAEAGQDLPLAGRQVSPRSA